MIQHINHHIWYKVCRPLRKKYRISTNCILVLNGAYTYNKFISSTFTRRKLLDFVSYYDNSKIGKYITVLMGKGLIVENGDYRGYILYSISDKGIEAMNDLNESYKKELDLFVSLYGISL